MTGLTGLRGYVQFNRDTRTHSTTATDNFVVSSVPQLERVEQLVHGELEEGFVELQKGEHNAEVHVAGVMKREHVRRDPGHRLP